ncbi:MAG: thioredoxin family protein [Bdellovibrionales bacterium]|nr:thioredoxin family protein [Bdellovibrionales bacterium]
MQSLTPGVNWFGLKLELEPEWHSYWRNPGDSASAPIFDFDLPEGVRLRKIHYPKPSRFAIGPLWSIGYGKEVIYLFEVEVEEGLSQTDAYQVTLDAEWVVCKVECVPGLYKFEMPITYASESTATTEYQKTFDLYRGQLPATELIDVSLSKKSDHFLLKADPIAFQDYQDVFAFHNGKVSNAPAVRVGPGEFKFEESNLKSKDSKPDQFLVTYKNDKPSAVLTVQQKQRSLLMMLGFAFLGGLILNLMPCVFPVLALKVYSLSKLASQQKTTAIVSQVVYTAGVLVSFWILAGLIVGLRSFGSNLGWGFHLQSPWFVGFMLVLFVLMAFAFLGWMPVSFYRFSGMGQGLTEKKGHVGSFFTGVLAVVVASPCTAPFMGVAMGYALSQSTAVVLLIFTGIGLGLAFPFLLFAVAPGLTAMLPRPGAWMERLKKAMALPLLGTSLWLAWVLSLQLQALEEGHGHYEKFTEARVESELKAGHPVFVNFTAAWCISCQVNEQVVFSSKEVQDFFSENKVIQLKADWTNRDERIGAVLKRYERAGVPLYLFYSEKNEGPEVLPEILTQAGFLSRAQELLKK